MRTRRLGVWPSLPFDVYLRRKSHHQPFPLGDPACRLYSRARHALWSGCRTIGLQAGDEVMAPAYHHGSEIEAMLQAGLRIRFFDVTEALEPDPAELERILRPSVRVLYLIHYLGFPQDIARWRSWCDERGLLLFEDAAQAWLATRDGIPVGSHGDLAIFCMYKTIGVPDGAALICRRPASPSTSRRRLGSLGLARRHGAWLAQKDALAATVLTELSEVSKRIAGPRSGSAKDEFELGNPNEPRSLAAELILRKAYQESIAERRRTNSRYLLNKLSAWVPAPFASLPVGASPFAFPIEADEPGRLVKDLQPRGVNALLLWKHPHPSLAVANYPTARRLRETLIALPVHQELTSANLRQIANAVQEALG